MFHLPPIFAFGLANLPMLGWLAAAAAPLVIHLWSRRRHQEVSWAAMEYLVAAVRRQSRRLRCEQWLLLVIRTLLIVVLVLAVSEPYLDRSGLAVAPAGQTHRVLVIDASYSMAYKAAGTSRFAKAQAVARQIVDDGPPGDAFTLVLLAAPPRVIVGTAAFEPHALLEEIDNLRPQHTTADLPATLTVLTALLKDVQRNNPRLTRHEVFFLTDLQRVTWLPPEPTAAQAAFLHRCTELAQMATLTLIDLGAPAAENLAITDLRTLDFVPTVGRLVTLEVDLKKFGRQPSRQQPVELFVDGQRVDEKPVDVPAGGAATLAFTQRFETAGDHTVEVRALGDPLEIDNHRYLVVPVREAIRALCIDGHPSGVPFHGAADYLAVALASEDGSGEHPPIHSDVAAESALLERNLAAYDCVFLCNVAQFTAGEARVLDTYLKNGGNLVFFVGDQVQADSYNRELGGGAGQGTAAAEQHAEQQAENGRAPIARLLPARLGRIVDHAQFRLDPLNYRHPIVQAFRGRGQSALLTTPVFKHIQLEMRPDATAQTVLALADGDPLIVAQPVHRGRVVLVGTSADATWSALPLWPSFVPLVQEIAAWCVGTELQQRNILVGAPLDAPLAAAADIPLIVQTPDGRDCKEQLHVRDNYGDLAYSDTMQSGFYTVRLGTPGNRRLRFAVNVDTTESDLTAIDSKTLRNDVWPGIRCVPWTARQPADDTTPRGALAGRSRLPVALLYTVLGLLFLETFLAWRFGYRTT